MENMDLSFWKGKRVFLTGHTGFKGSWLALWLNQLGTKVFGYALAPDSNPNLYSEAHVNDYCYSTLGDLADSKELLKAMFEAQPDVVFHLAAQPLVRASYLDPKGTFTTNVIGTLNVLEACRTTKSVRSVVVVTTDKVYENSERMEPYEEHEPLGGYDPYSSSKACVEILTSSYYRSFLAAQSMGVATARAGNVIGGGDWASDRLIPDAIRAWSTKSQFIIRNPNATRPWQHVLEPLSGYLILAERLFKNPKTYSRAFNFGPEHDSQASVMFIVEQIKGIFGNEFKLQLEPSSLHEAQHLGLSISLAKQRLSWNPRWDLTKSIAATLEWYKGHQSGLNATSLCLEQIQEYSS